MADMNEIDKRFDIHEIAKNKLQDLDRYLCTIYCCHSTGCKSSGSDDILDLLKSAVAEHELEGKVRIVATGCMGLCAQGPLVRVEIKGQKDVLYKRLEPLVARIIISEHVIPALKLEAGEAFELPEFLSKYVLSLDLPFFTKQEKVVLKQAGHLDPEDIQEYIARGGYLALEKVLKTMTPAEVAAEIKKSGLRGRGGAGFPTGLKWELAAKVPVVDDKFIICNGDEGDPGAYMDRSILESNPHDVIEGMMIAAYAIGATEGWFYIRAEYPLAVERIEKAIKACKKNRLLGNNIMNSGFNFNIDIRLGAGAFGHRDGNGHDDVLRRLAGLDGAFFLGHLGGQVGPQLPQLGQVCAGQAPAANLVALPAHHYGSQGFVYLGQQFFGGVALFGQGCFVFGHCGVPPL